MHPRYRFLAIIFAALAVLAPGAHAAETRQIYKSQKIKKYKAPKIKRYKAPKINRRSNRIH
jgi:hypothetical protein